MSYFKLIELNYFFSTFKLTEVCELKNFLLDNSITLPSFLLEKTDIFCLTIDNKLAEAKLLNSLLKDTEETIDTSFFDEKIIVDNDDYYFSNVIARASKTMSDCHNEKAKLKNTGTDG